MLTTIYRAVLAFFAAAIAYELAFLAGGPASGVILPAAFLALIVVPIVAVVAIFYQAANRE